jgi:hypothetical protein
MGKCWFVACGVKIAAAALLSVFQAGAENIMSSTIITWGHLDTTETGEHYVQAISDELANIARRSVHCGAAPFVHHLLDGGCLCEDDHGMITYFQLRSGHVWGKRPEDLKPQLVGDLFFNEHLGRKEISSQPNLLS